MAENPFEKYRNMLPSGKMVGELPPETQTPDASAADTADVPGGGALPQVQPQPDAVAGSREAWRDVVDTSIQPGPNVGNIIPASRDPETGRVRLALPNPARAILTEAPGGTTPGIVNDPVTGAPSLTPEMQAAGSLPGALRFGAPRFVPPGTLDRPAELSPGVKRNLLAPDIVTSPSRPAGPSMPTGIPQQPEMRAVPSPGEASTPQPRPPDVSGGRPTTAVPGSNEAILASAKSVADQHYGVARAAGRDSTYTPQSVGKMVDAVDSAAPQGPGERAVGGENAVTRLQRDMQPLRDQSLTLADVQRMDERMSDHITEEYRAGRKKVAMQLEDIQQKWREQADNATAADVTGGEAGFRALAPGRQAWSQYRKMSDVMLMKERADMTQNPTTSYKTAVKNFVTSNKSRGWTAEEKADLVASANRGVVGSTLHLLGSRLLPHVGGAVGASVGGIPGFLAGEVVTHGLGAAARTGANTMQGGRVNRVMGTLGGSVPAPPTNELLLR